MRNNTQAKQPLASRTVARIENLENRQYRAGHQIGINVNDSSSNAFDVAVPQLKKLGVDSVRLWYGVDQWSDQKMEGGLKRAIDYHNAGFDVTLTIAIDDKKVPNPADVKAWFKWATSNEDLKKAVDFWQVGNEVDSDNYFKGTLSEYVSHFLKPAAQVLHAEGEKVISGSVSWNPDDVKSMIGFGMLDMVDAVGYHPYAKGVALQKQRINEINDIVDGRKPIVATEWNIRGYENDKSNWATAVGDAFNQVRAGFALDYYFSLFTVNTPAGPAGLMSNKGVINSSFYNAFLKASNGVGTTPNNPVNNNPSSTETKIALYNADTDKVISGYTNLKAGQVIDLASLPTRNLAIVVLPTKNAGSVKFNLNGTTKIENSLPYAYFGDAGGNLNGKKMTAGSYSLSVTPYAKDGAKGAAYATTAINFKLTDSKTTTPTTPTTGNNGTDADTKAEIKAFALVNAATGKALSGYGYLTGDVTIKLSDLATKNVALIALADEDTKSVKLSGGDKSRTENTVPYAFFGDSNGKLGTWTAKAGKYDFTATAYADKNGKGSIGSSLSITLKFV